MQLENILERNVGRKKKSECFCMCQTTKTHKYARLARTRVHRQRAVQVDKLSSLHAAQAFSAGAPAVSLQSGQEQWDSAINRIAATLLSSCRGNAVQLFGLRSSRHGCVRSGGLMGSAPSWRVYLHHQSPCSNAKTHTLGRTARHYISSLKPSYWKTITLVRIMRK